MDINIIKDKESLCDTILKNTSDLIYICDNNARVVFVNSAYEKVFGVKASDVIGKNTLAFNNNDKTAATEGNEKAMETGETIITENTALTQSGLSTFQLKRSLWKDDGGNIIGVIGTAHDITERKKMEQALRSNEANCHAMFEHCPMGIAVADAKGKIIQSNAAFEGMLCYSREELRGMDLNLFTHPEDMESETPYVKEILEGKRDHYEVTKRYLRKDGKAIWVRLIAITFLGADGGKLRLVMAEDVTERRRAEAQLQKTGYLLNTIFSGIDDHMYLKDKKSRIIMVNPATARHFDIPIDQMTGKSELEFFVDKALAQKVIDNDKRVMDSGETLVVEEEVRFDDGVRTFLSKKVPWRDEEGKVIGLFGISRDITERKRDITRLKESEERALSLVQKLEEADRKKNEFLSALSHELRNPLAAISAGLQLMDATSDQAHINTAKEIMKRQMDQLCRLVDDLLDLMRINHNKIELKHELFELNELIAHSAADLKPLFDKKGIDIHFIGNKEEIYVNADPVRIKQITGNLLHNALKFTEYGGKVIMTVCEREGQAVICVKDTGIGIRPGEISCLFEPFAQLDKNIDRRYGGLGLGLAIVKVIARLHGGDASAFSEGEGRGSSFFIHLPISHTGDFHKNKETGKVGRTRSVRVLVIEDNKDYCDMICAMLRHLGYETDCAHDGFEGVKKAKKCLPNGIICDIGLPGMSGYEVAQEIRGDESFKNVLLVALSGYTGQDDIDMARKAGFDRHIAKPVNIEFLKSVLNEE